MECTFLSREQDFSQPTKIHDWNFSQNTVYLTYNINYQKIKSFIFCSTNSKPTDKSTKWHTVFLLYRVKLMWYCDVLVIDTEVSRLILIDAYICELEQK